MLFNSLDFAIFLPVVLLLYSLLRFRGQNRALLAASFVFYGFWDWRFLLLLFSSALVDFSISHCIARAREPTTRRRWLVLALLVNFGVLFVFKYFDFFAVETSRLLGYFGLHASLPMLHVVLPVGISFLTFQEMGYTIDVYRGDMAPADSFFDYLLFVSYFPHLIAGPIQRSGNLLRQLQRPRRQTPGAFYSGLFLLLFGLFRKVCIADNLSTYVDNVYGHAADHSGKTLAFASYLFAFQIYCDFCGYSDMAVGMARMMGIDLIYNFRAPYLATSFREFWRRWHISLSTWFRDYLYIPLGGNRVGPARDAVNVMTVFLVSGLWHGANYTFVIWGGLHGLYLVLERFARLAPKRAPGFGGRWARRVLVFHFVVFGWIFFRAESLGHAWSIVRGLARPGGLFWFPPLANGLAMLVVMMLIEIVAEPEEPDTWLMRQPIWFHGLFAVGIIVALLTFGARDGGQFIYFQF